MTSGDRVAAVIVAGGTGERLGLASGKQLAVLGERPVLAWTVETFCGVPSVEFLVVVCPPDRVEEYGREAVEAVGPSIPVLVVAGGQTRQESVAAGIAEVPVEYAVIVVHDGARPLVEVDTVQRCVQALLAGDFDGVVVGHPSVDTLKLVDGDRITHTPPREAYWAVQTPQAFRSAALRAAHAAAAIDGFVGTDDASLVERAGGDVRVIEGPRDNIKITLPEDLAFAEAVLRHRREGGA